MRFEVTATYPDGVKMIMHDETEPGRGPRGNKFVGTEGWVSVDDTGKVTASSDAIMRKLSAAQRGYEFMEGHHRDFLDCVRTRARTIAAPEVAHRSTTICHIANICLRLGRKLQWDPVGGALRQRPRSRPHARPRDAKPLAAIGLSLCR